MSANATISTDGIGFVGLLTIAFIVLKLTHYIDWPWVWVLSPLWITATGVLLMFTIIVIIAVVAHMRASS